MRRLGPFLIALGFSLGYAGCPKFEPFHPEAPKKVSGAGGSITVVNKSKTATVVYVAFGADSVVLPPSWAFCTATSTLNCTFPLAGKGQQTLPTSGKYLNATISFGQPVGCGATKVELNVQNPSWYDVVDISLVDGYSTPVSIEIDGQTLGPVVGPTGNENLYGVYPMGCDICVARSSGTPCGQTPGSKGCKAGTQYNPHPPCQHQGKTLGGGSTITVALEGP